MSSKYVQRRAARPKDLKGTVRRILGYVFSFKAQILLVVSLIVLSVIASVASSYFLKPLINDYITPLMGQENPDFSGLLGMIGIMAAVYLTGAAGELFLFAHHGDDFDRHAVQDPHGPVRAFAEIADPIL